MLSKKLRTPIQLFPRQAKPIFSDNYIVIKSHPNNINRNRLGVLVGRHVSKSAVYRNKLKRTVISSFENQINLSKNTKRKDLLIILKPPIINLTIKEIKTRFKEYGKFIK